MYGLRGTSSQYIQHPCILAPQMQLALRGLTKLEDTLHQSFGIYMSIKTYCMPHQAHCRNNKGDVCNLTLQQ